MKRLARCFGAATLFFTMATAPAVLLGQSPLAPTRIELRAGDKIPVANQFARTGLEPIRCDAKGSVYMRPTVRGAPVLETPILQMVADGLSTKLFESKVLPEIKESKGFSVQDFAISSRGRIFEVVTFNTKDNKKVTGVVEFSEDGQSASLIRIDSHLEPRQMALFPSGLFLLSGRWVSSVSPANGPDERPFTGIFDRAGKLIAEVVLPQDAPIQSSTEADPGKPLEDPQAFIDLSQALAGDDGNVYLIRAGKILRVFVISGAGEIVRTFTVAPSSDKVSGPSIFYGAGRLAFSFFEPGTAADPKMQNVIRLVDAQTGETLWDYVPAKDLFGIPACYNGADFTLLTVSQDRQLALQKASPR